MTNLLPSLPYAYASEHGVIVLQGSDGPRVIGYRENATLGALLEAQRLCLGVSSILVLSDQAFNKAMAERYSSSARQAADMAAAEDGDLASLADTAAEVEDLLDESNDAPVVRLINALLSEAIRENASDIHIESHETRLVIRFRIDGVLHDRIEPKRTLAPMLVSRIKVMAGLDIAEKRKPHDGRVSLRIGGHEVDVRVSTIPSQYGERVVLRLLDRSTARFELAELGMSARDYAIVERLLERPSGLILVTGPTGSGKTTTLYSAVTRLNTRARSIMTVEDPIEYAFDGIGQMQVSPKKDVTFASGVYALMRQDPDVILIGEVRDRETASAAVWATESGHLVLSTLHTRSAVASVSRLLDMGVERYKLAPLLAGLIAQRLVRKLCAVCRVEDTVSEGDAKRLGGLMRFGERIYRAQGCETCKMQGYVGRTAIYEVVEVDARMEALFHEGASEAELLAAARKAGPSLLMDGVRVLKLGHTTLEEVLAAAEVGDKLMGSS